ncbi:MAG TPA: DEAD/DEAH box helicase [Candidatus Paceibacterota bacterium]
MDPPKTYQEIIIFGITPSFLERGDLPFEENLEQYKNLRLENSFWRRNSAVLETGAKKNPSGLARELSDLGYEHYRGEVHKGEFFQQGGLITIFPINHKNPVTIEFSGNVISGIEDAKIVPHESIFPIRRLADGHKLEPGDYVVHEDHGIGIFRCVEKNYFVMEYAAARKGGPASTRSLVGRGGQADRLLVPERLSKKISPYLGLKNPQISRLGTLLWIQTKKKAREDIMKFASELLELYKKRSGAARPPYLPDALEKEIWNKFDYVETESQTRALEEIFKDFSKDTPMERLLVGDVGFGKTEVALRAALRVALAGKQVALLAPTTVLADQHTELFKKRMGNSGIEAERFTRLESKKRAREILEKLAKGAIDILVGTHRVLSKNLNFKSLGLLIIDEEQRFGVKQKEVLKKRYPEVDILYLSATPIPRTLAFSLSKIRPLSAISDPPPGRLAIMTFVLPRSEKIIKEAVQKELARAGQVYFLASRISKIPAFLETIKDFFPKIKTGALHGRMPEEEIIKTMRAFREGEIKILISTTIIENGLDISSVNTLLAEDATRLGLAQAHQLRGRIGRGDKQAYAYFLYPSKKLAPQAARRLETLLEFQELGAGFEIAKRDLELRGAGNILGREQSGVMNRIGWNLYFQYLSDSLETMTTA